MRRASSGCTGGSVHALFDVYGDSVKRGVRSRAACRAHLDTLGTAAPHSRVLALRPLNGAHGDDIAVVADELADRRTGFVDTRRLLDPSRSEFNGAVHPGAQGHRKAAGRLGALLTAEQQRTARTTSTDLPEGAVVP
ncbi:hypothetical protein DI272_07715 [Streptomyces sp. Act143]|uniref:hypothetical protein n=1 Tax=Streptomyces sp. Act143 TaxID=2200760 RepID=UPI000D675993|nr:hypothetical protein [Streptomyces sp. Act143]PWI14053.1 hypothetical protein DI272_07715 [Streptomyces sp. Act143]